VDSDGRISLAELRRIIRSDSYTKDIPEHTVKQILKRADEDANGYIEYPEFLKMVCDDTTDTILVTLFHLPASAQIQTIHGYLLVKCRITSKYHQNNSEA
jgi:hypothetical protein